MPRGPQGQKRPGDVIGAAVMVAKIATGEVADPIGRAPNRAKGGKIGGKARAQKLTPDQRSEDALSAVEGGSAAGSPRRPDVVLRANPGNEEPRRVKRRGSKKEATMIALIDTS